MAREWGWLSANDVRRMEGMEPIGEGGDIYLQPASYEPAKPIPSEKPAVPDNVISLPLRQLATDGRDGVDGRSITAARLSSSGDLLLSFSDGTETNVGRIKADPAPAPPRSVTFVRDASGRVIRSELVH